MTIYSLRTAEPCLRWIQNKRSMQSACLRESSQVRLHECCLTPFFCLPESQNTNSKPRSSTSECRQNFRALSRSSVFPNAQFTSHDSLPSLQEAFTEFTKVYPQYSDTNKVDQIRAKEYYHLQLLNFTCLDYIGTGLFSYSQLQKKELTRIAQTASSSTLPPPRYSDFPFFTLSHKTGNLKEELLGGGGGQESEFESAIKKRIMEFLNISEWDYCMVFTANKTSAFKMVAQLYPFQSNAKLLTVYDYDSEAVQSMVNISGKKGAEIMSAEFSWPRLRIRSENLRKMIVSNSKKKRKNRALFVFPLHSRMTGSKYPYVWMRQAQENGWDVLVDACALGPKDMDSFGLSVFQPEFLISSFYKIFGDNPSGFACLFVKRSTLANLESSISAGIVNIIPAKPFNSESPKNTSNLDPQEDLTMSRSSAGFMPFQTKHPGPLEPTKESNFEDTSPREKEYKNSQTEQIRKPSTLSRKISSHDTKLEPKCSGLDYVDSLGLTLINTRGRCLINWLVNALTKLQHPNKDSTRLVRIYGPKIRFDRGPALAFNVFDCKGQKIEPVLIQRLASRSRISLSYAFLHNIWFPEKYAEDKEKFLEIKGNEVKRVTGNKRNDKDDHGIKVVSAAMVFLANFEDAYRLWSFVARFLDAQFVEKERWKYTAIYKKHK